jgi:protein PET117
MRERLRSKMSPASKTILGAASSFTVATVILVHFQQKSEQAAMHQGVVRDLEQQQIKKQRQLDFDMQQALEADYKMQQSVSRSVGR